MGGLRINFLYVSFPVTQTVSKSERNISHRAPIGGPPLTVYESLCNHFFVDVISLTHPLCEYSVWISCVPKRPILGVRVEYQTSLAVVRVGWVMNGVWGRLAAAPAPLRLSIDAPRLTERLAIRPSLSAGYCRLNQSAVRHGSATSPSLVPLKSILRDCAGA